MQGASFYYFIILFSLSVSVFLKLLFTKKPTHKLKLPPGPPTLPIFGNLNLLLKPWSELKQLLQTLHVKYGPIFSLRLGSKPLIVVASHSLSHEALIVNGAIFANRPPAFATEKFLSCNQQNISSGFYRPIWLHLRRNLTTNILHPSRLQSYACARKRVQEILINRLMSASENSSGKVEVLQYFQHAVFCLLAVMCFGDDLQEEQINDIEYAQRRLLLSFGKYNMINIMPESLGRILFSKRWEELFQLRRDQESVLLPLIRARRIAKVEDRLFLSYVDTLLDLHLHEDHRKRKLEEREIVTLCSEFLSAGTDTTLTALQWIMANLVKYPHIQETLYMEMKRVVGEKEVEIKEDYLQKMIYLKAVILEGLRLHPPSHFLIPHAVTEDVVLGGFLVPRNSTLIFMVADIGRDPSVWENPTEFKPERFLGGEEGNGSSQAFDITGSREIKMIPFGAGRRMCPAYSMAILHLQYFVANLVWIFKWDAAEGEDVNLCEKHGFTTVMKNPLQVQITPRVRTSENLLVRRRI